MSCKRSLQGCTLELVQYVLETNEALQRTNARRGVLRSREVRTVLNTSGKMQTTPEFPSPSTVVLTRYIDEPIHH
jgi:hypothetical protein